MMNSINKAESKNVVHFTCHATIRAQQRNLYEREVDYVLQHGQLVRRTGIRFFFLAARSIPAEDRNIPWVQKLVGTTVLLDSGKDIIITIYKNRSGLGDIRKKMKYRI